MMTEPEIFDNSLKLDPAAHKRKRRFKIFDTKPSPAPTSREVEPQIFLPVASVVQKRELTLTRPVEMVKIEPKCLLEREFYGQEQEEGGGGEDEIQLLEVRMDEYQTVRSNRFCGTDCFKELPTPSVLIKNGCLVINEASELYQSVKQVRDSQTGLQNEFRALWTSVGVIDSSVRLAETAAELAQRQLQEMQLFLEAASAERESYERRVSEVDRRISRIELALSRHREELQVFEEEDGQRVEVEEEQRVMDQDDSEQEEEDEFVETHYLPVQFITKYLQQRKSQSKIEQIERAQQATRQREAREELGSKLKLFHPIFKIGEYEYGRLVEYLLQELPSLTAETITFRLLFRRGTTDLDVQSVGQKAELEYKAGLLFVVKTSTGKRIGGFISNYLVQGESMEDGHAFLFTLQDRCHKFRIKEESCGEAFAASRHYLVTFSSDLMISSNCLEEENYCEWPSSYASLLHYDNAWLAGDFEFMIEHIEVFEVTAPE